MKAKYLIFIVVFCGLSNYSLAGTGGGEVQHIMVHSQGGNGSGVIMFKTGVNANKASCSTSDGGTQWAFSLENESGKAMYALLLSAQAHHKSIWVEGADDCAAWGDRERPFHMHIAN